MNLISTLKLFLGIALIFSSQLSYGQYCMPTADCTYGDGVTEFGVGSFTNSSACGDDNGVAGYSDFTALTGLDLGQGAPYSISLLSGYADQQMSIWIDMDNSMSFDSSELIITDMAVGTDLVVASITIPAIPLGAYRLRIKSVYDAPSSLDPCGDATYGETEDYTLNVIAAPTCFIASDLTATSISSNSALIGWTGNGAATVWDLEIVEVGVTPTGIPTVGYDDITNPIMITGLLPITAYDVYVRSDCGMDNTTDVSLWSGPVSFVTECSSFTPDYAENFSTLTNQLPDCWSNANAGDPTTGPSMFGTSSWIEDGFANDGITGALRINLYQGGVENDWLISPIFDLSSGGPYQVDFKFSITDYNTSNATILGSDDRVQFLISSDVGATWTSLQSWDSQSNVNPLGEIIVHDLTPYAGMNVMLAFWGSDGTVDDLEDNDITIDDFFVRTPPTCIEPSGLMAGNIQSNTAEVSWTENGTATIGDIEFGEMGFIPTSVPTTGYDDVSNPAVIMGLTPTTAYDVYVRADCSGNNSDASAWIGPVTFTTACAIFPAPYVQDFEVTPTECWEQADNGTPMTGPIDLGLSSWFSSTFANNGTDNAFRINLYTLGKDDWLISPVIALTGGTFDVEFDFSITAYNTSDSSNLGSDDRVMFLISTDNMTTWTTLSVWTANSNVNPLGEHFTNSLAAFNGMNVNFAFWATEGLVDDIEDNDVFVDNFEVSMGTPAVLAATTGVTNVTCNGLANGAIDLTVTGGVLPFNFAWSNASTDEDIDNLTAGSYTVTVTDAVGTIVEMTEMVMEPTELVGSAVTADETVDGAADGSIDLTVSGGMAGYSFSWDNGATTEDIDGLADGTYCVTITDANGCTQSTCADVMAGPVSIQNISDLTSFKVYPNPVGNEKFLIDLEFSLDKDIDIQLINAFGQEVYQSRHFNVSDLKTEVNAAKLPAGIYFVKVTSLEENQIMTYRLIKQ